MDYQGHLDITRAEISTSAPFIYLTIFVEEAPPANSTAKYGIEIDLDRDGRGDWLIYGQAPTTSNWTSAGVRGYKDDSNDVGASIPITAEGAVSGLNGYDNLFFDQGYNTIDSDGAWIRLDPSNSTHIQLAFKSSLIGSPDTFMWGAWADEGPREPAWFDYNDHFSPAEAGSPISYSPDYPIKQLYSVDNTCRWGYGFNPTGSEPGVCYVQPTPVPTNTPTPVLYGYISGGVWKDKNGNGVINSGEDGFSGVTVRLGSGSCGSTGLATQTTSSSGGYSFGNLTAGTYCVSVNITVSCGGWISTTPTQYTVVLGPGENKFVSWFGYANYVCY
jgi:hypothetical protein